MTNIYIRSAACISPKNTGEPDYKAFIDPKALRRMSRIIRMGVATARICLQEASLVMPDAIVTGTGYGCLEDTSLFLKSMIQRNEDTLQPATFIQSTHNTVGAQIALLLQCTGYNNTFVHRGFSFESALLDAILLLREGDASAVLVGGVDELTDDSHAILRRFGLYRHAPAGEGAAFFLLASRPSGEDYARVDGMTTIYKPESREEAEREIHAFLKEQAVDPASIDLVIGDEILPGRPTMPYKPQSGEYPTSTAYALWLAAQYIKTGAHKRIMVYNQYLGIHHAAFLLSGCDQ
ncbi:MAG TPA: beta-ketoacyl synthase chain length factor [Puia sp.]|nr:beta-ketoacyl synthase chain length factor [Puia sp.]